MGEQWDLDSVRGFFGPRAERWEERTAKDPPRIATLVGSLGLRAGDTVLDVGCGTGRAVPFLREAVGEGGRVVAVDATPEMLAEARRLGRDSLAELLEGDVHALPFEDGSFDAVYAQGLLPHLSDPARALGEWARVTRPGGRLAVAHVLGREAMGLVHQGVPATDRVLDPGRLAGLLGGTGWRLERLEDALDHYLALAAREG